MKPQEEQQGPSPLVVSVGIFIACLAIAGSLGWFASRSNQQSAVVEASTATPVVQVAVDTPVPLDTQVPDTQVPDTQVPDTAIPAASVAFMLATIQQGYTPDPNDILVHQFDRALDRLQTKCIETRKNLSDFAVVIHDSMFNKGVEESYLSILTHVYDSFPADMTTQGSCKEVFAAYATLRIDGP